MLRKTALSLTAAAFMLTATPAYAQDAEEPPRTTYRIQLLNFSPGGSAQWSEVMDTYVNPTREELGMPKQEVHWLMAGQWEVMIITEMPRGLAVLDQHQGPRMQRLNEAIVAKFGSEEEAKAMREKIDASITGQMVTYSHTHP